MHSDMKHYYYWIIIWHAKCQLYFYIIGLNNHVSPILFVGYCFLKSCTSQFQKGQWILIINSFSLISWSIQLSLKTFMNESFKINPRPSFHCVWNHNDEGIWFSCFSNNMVLFCTILDWKYLHCSSQWPSLKHTCFDLHVSCICTVE